MGLLDSLSLLVTAAALLAAAVCLAVSRQPRQAMPVLLDMLTAAGLLRLAADASYSRSLAAAAIVAIRHLVVFGLKPRTGPPGLSAAGRRPGPPPSGTASAG